jgi:hypothetical protein
MTISCQWTSPNFCLGHHLDAHIRQVLDLRCAVCDIARTLGVASALCVCSTDWCIRSGKCEQTIAFGGLDVRQAGPGLRDGNSSVKNFMPA